MSVAGGALGMLDGEIKNAGAPVNAENKFYVAGRGRFRPFTLNSEEYHDFTIGLPCPMVAVYDVLNENIGGDFARALFGDDEDETAQKTFFWNTTWRPAIDSALWLQDDLVGSDHNPMLRGQGPFCYDVRVLKQLPKRQRGADRDINDDETRAQALNKLRMVRSNADQWPDALRQVIFRGEPAAGEEGIQYNGLDVGGDDAMQGLTVDGLRFHPDYIDEDGRVGIRTIAHEWGLEVHFVKGGLAQLDDDLEGGMLSAFQEAAVVKPVSTYGTDPVQGENEAFSLYELLKGGSTISRMASIAEVLSFDKTMREGNSALVYEASPLPQLASIVVRAFSRGPEFEALWKRLPRGNVLVWIPPADSGLADGYFSGNRLDVRSVKWFAKHTSGRAMFAVRAGEFGSKHTLLARALACDQLADAAETILDMGLRGGHMMLCKN